MEIPLLISSMMSNQLLCSLKSLISDTHKFWLVKKAREMKLVNHILDFQHHTVDSFNTDKLFDNLFS